MDRAQVIHLEKSLGHDLPIATKVGGRSLHYPQRRIGDVAEFVGQRTEPLDQRRGVGAGTDEDEPTPALAAHTNESPCRRVEVDEVSLVGNTHQVAVQVVAP